MVNKAQFNPTVTNSDSIRIPLATSLLYRDSSRNTDARLINCFQESIKNEQNEKSKSRVVPRPGTTQYLQVKVGGGVARGIVYFNSKFYSVIDNGLYENATLKTTLSTSTGKVGFERFDNAGVQYLFLCDGTNAYVIDTSGTVTQVNQTYSAWQASYNYSIGNRVIPTVANGYYYEVTTDAGSSAGSQPTWPITIGATVVDGGITWTCKGEYGGFPTPHIPTPKFVDGYMCLIKANTMDIYNSDTDNIYGWGASNFVSAEMWPDNVLSLIRQNNQIMALGEYSTEFFYDAGNASGSPFARNDGTVLQIGTCAPYATFETEKFCMFVGQSNSGGRAVWLLDGFQPKKVSNEPIERILDVEGTSIVNALGYGIRVKGHLFFVMILSTTTLVYDIDEKVWHEWAINSGGTNVNFPYTFIADAENGTFNMLHTSDGYIYSMPVSVNQDNGVNIICDIYTGNWDGNTMNRKFIHNLNLVGDLGKSFTLRWSDDDYQSWTNYRTLYTTRYWVPRCGATRRRSYHIRHMANEDWRLEHIEFEYDQGTH